MDDSKPPSTPYTQQSPSEGQIQPFNAGDITNGKKRIYQKPVLKKYGPINRLTLFGSSV